MFARASRQKKNHTALFGGATIHFTMTTRASFPFELEAASRRLLKRDVAVAAAWPSETQVRLTPRLRPIDRGIARVLKLREEQEKLSGANSIFALLRFGFRHPVWMFSALRSKRADDADAFDWDVLENELLEAASVVHDAQAVSGIERDMDSHYVGGTSRDDDHFVRLLLRSSAHVILVPGDGDAPEREVRVVAEPRLLLHRSGVVQLTIAFPIPDALTTSQVVRLSRSDQARVLQSEIPETFLVWRNEKNMPGEWMEDLDAGVRRRHFSWDEPLTVAVLLEELLQSVGHRIKRRLPTEWNTYATVMTDRGECCKTSQKWLDCHSADLARVVSRYANAGDINHQSLMGKDFSIRRDSSFYLTLASATHIELEGPNEGGIGDLSTVLIVEYALLHYARLRALESRVQEFDLGPGLESNYREFVALAADMRHGDVRYGSAREMTQHLVTSLGGFDLFESIEKSLGLLAQAHDTELARQHAGRNFRLTWIATALAVLLAIPAANTAASVVAGALRELRGTPLAGAANSLADALAAGGSAPALLIATVVLLPFVWVLIRSVLRACFRLAGITRRVLRRRGWSPTATAINTFYDPDGSNPERRTE